MDNFDISKISQDNLRENIAFVPQDPILFHRSLMDNIRYGKRDATDEEVEFIIWEETGYPQFWEIPQDGNTPEECFRKQLKEAAERLPARELVG